MSTGPRQPASFHRLEPGTASPADVDEVGGKGANLLRLAARGLPVPAGFVIGTGLCRYYHAHDGTLPDGFR
ncbi:MAG: PEP/pyruvate-binding domain-containing protein, partial [Gammaproteobacteria bacterium]